MLNIRTSKTQRGIMESCYPFIIINVMNITNFRLYKGCSFSCDQFLDRQSAFEVGQPPIQRQPQSVPIKISEQKFPLITYFGLPPPFVNRHRFRWRNTGAIPTFRQTDQSSKLMSCSCIPHWRTRNKLSFYFFVCVCMCGCRCSCSFVQGVTVNVFLLPERSSLCCADFSSRKDRNSRLRCRLQIRISVSTQYFKWTIHLNFWVNVYFVLDSLV